jgi:hypothetical protein
MLYYTVWSNKEGRIGIPFYNIEQNKHTKNSPQSLDFYVEFCSHLHLHITALESSILFWRKKWRKESLSYLFLIFVSTSILIKKYN